MAPPRNYDEYPSKQLLVLAICRLAEPIAFMSIVAYSFAMVQEIKGNDNASFYSNVLVSAFALAEASTSMFWGALSDRYGRKPIILLGLAGTAVSSLLFGFATNYWFALLARIVGGALNGNMAVMQTMIAEIVTNPEHEPRAYALQPFMWNLGSIVGSALGGYTAQPARFYPNTFSPDGIFGRFPYLLPNLISVAVLSFATIQGYFLLEETYTPATKTTRINETSPLIRRRSQVQSVSDLASPGPGRISTIASCTPTPMEPSFDIRRASFGSINRLNPLDKTVPFVEVVFEDDQEDHQVKAFTKPVVLWIIALVLNGCHQVGFGAILPVYLLDQPCTKPMQLDLVGGLGLTLHDVGTYLALISVIALFVQGVIFPPYLARLGVWKALLSLTIFCPVVYIAIAFVSLMPNPNVGVYIILVFQNIATIITYPCLLILLKNATPSPRVLGRVNGLAMAACSGARTIFPPLVGIIYSVFGSAGAWWSCALVATAAIIELFFIPRPAENNQNILRKASTSFIEERPNSE